MSVHRFALWRKLPDGRVVRVGRFGLNRQPNGKIDQCDFQYDQAYLQHPETLALCPKTLPLDRDVISMRCEHELPGFIDDCYPGRWAEKLIAHRLGQRHANKIDVLNNLIGGSIGAVRITPDGAPAPEWPDSIPLADVEDVLRVISSDQPEQLFQGGLDQSIITYGTGSVGGARPKLLVRDAGREWLAKMNTHRDPYDNARVEWACLEVCRRAGLQVPATQIQEIAGIPTLLIERFDIAGGSRVHVLTANGMLKEPGTQYDPHAGSYEDIAELIRRYSADPIADLGQLFGQALVNHALSNKDDHLRNFSFISTPKGLRLTPAYDIVPDLTLGQSHQISLNRSFNTQSMDSAKDIAKSLKVPAEVSAKVAQGVLCSVGSWGDVLKESGLPAPEAERFLDL